MREGWYPTRSGTMGVVCVRSWFCYFFFFFNTKSIFAPRPFSTAPRARNTLWTRNPQIGGIGPDETSYLHMDADTSTAGASYGYEFICWQRWIEFLSHHQWWQHHAGVTCSRWSGCKNGLCVEQNQLSYQTVGYPSDGGTPHMDP